MRTAIRTVATTLLTISTSLAVDVTVFEAHSGSVQKTATLEIDDELLLPMDLVTNEFGLGRKELSADKVGICRDDICIPFPIGEKKGAVRTTGKEQWVPIERLTHALGGRMLLDEDSAALLLDLSPRQITADVGPRGPIDLTLPDLDGNPIQLAAFRGKKVVLFAWASW